MSARRGFSSWFARGAVKFASAPCPGTQAHVKRRGVIVRQDADEQVGRLRYSRPQERRVRPSRQIGLTELLERQPTSELFYFPVTTYTESGISGVQPKVLVPDADRTVGPVGRETGVHGLSG
jgi:hypothetical protein